MTMLTPSVIRVLICVGYMDVTRRGWRHAREAARRIRRDRGEWRAVTDVTKDTKRADEWKTFLAQLVQDMRAMLIVYGVETGIATTLGWISQHAHSVKHVGPASRNPTSRLLSDASRSRQATHCAQTGPGTSRVCVRGHGVLDQKYRKVFTRRDPRT